ncbi:phage tail fiber protein [Salmonella enterica]|uniref:phage tail fiber protein n=1 Tax=Salmonella enterica TaxID=28901 RepID=UPI002ED2EDB3|nr:hypothetical protein SM154_013935 [Salmonella enterica subsp. enterica serovar Newport str. DC_10-446]
MSGNNNTITAADAIITLTVNNLYPSGIQLQGFAADNVYGTDPLVLAETVRGIDGKLSAGFVYSNIIQTFHIMPDSPSRDILIPGQPHPGPAGLYSVVMLSCCFRR